MAPGEELYEMIRKRKFPLVGDGGGVSSFIHIADAAEGRDSPPRDRPVQPGTPSAPTASPAAMSSLAAPTSPAPSTESIPRTRPPSRYQTANGP